MPEHSIPKEPEVDSDETQEPQKLGTPRFADDPRHKGRSLRMPGDLSGEDPTEDPYSGTIAPRLAGERAKAMAVIDKVKEFVDKYADFAVEKLGGAKAGKHAETEPGKSSAVASRMGKKGGVKPGETKLPKEKVLKLIDALPMMDQSKMQDASRAIAHYIWTIHARVRQDLRKKTTSAMAKQGVTKWDVKRGKEGPEMHTTVDTGHPSYQAALDAASRDFNKDSEDIKTVINLLASAAGVLKRSGGGGSKADAAFLAKKPQFGKPPKVIPQPSQMALSKFPELQKLAGGPEVHTSASKASPSGPKATPPTVRKAPKVMSPVLSPEEDKEIEDIMKGESRKFDRFFDRIIEHACADRRPSWLDEI